MIRRPPRSTRTDTLFPYTTLFRSNNYYVARANALEGNVSLYYTLNGSRQTIAYKNAPVAPHRWHTLRVVFKGTTVQVALDGKTYIDLQDSHISGPGQVGVWTKADSVSLFDGFNYSRSEERRVGKECVR